MPAASNTRIDDFEIVEQEEDQVTPEEEAGRVPHRTCPGAGPQAGQRFLQPCGHHRAALTAYSSLSDEAKALLSAEKALLDSLVDCA